MRHLATLLALATCGCPAASAPPPPEGMVWIPGGAFTMGSDHALAMANERPPHRVEIGGFWMDETHVTNDQFAAFVAATGYVTTAERKPDWETIRVQLPPGTPRPPDEAFVAGAMVFVGTEVAAPLDAAERWWRFVEGASWRRPRGPGSTVHGKGDHPVVQVSHEDALAYARWAGKRLPTEAEWERAARGGQQTVFPWGDEMAPGGARRANYWDAERSPFPVVHKATGVAGTTPVRRFPRNGYGLYDMAGNAWQWVADWYQADLYRHRADATTRDPRGPEQAFDPSRPDATARAPRRVTRGGSSLCTPEHCLSFRTSARRGSDPHSPMSHIGFRLAKDAPSPR